MTKETKIIRLTTRWHIITIKELIKESIKRLNIYVIDSNSYSLVRSLLIAKECDNCNNETLGFRKDYGPWDL